MDDPVSFEFLDRTKWLPYDEALLSAQFVRAKEEVKAYCRRVYSIEMHDWQAEAAAHILCGKDVMVSAGTGYGKSLIFQTLLAKEGGTIIVIAPLTGLIAQQVKEFELAGIPAVQLTGTYIRKNPKQWTRIENGTARVVVSSPEMLLGQDSVFWHRLSDPNKSRSNRFLRNLVAIVVDEAHMIKKWSDFRPDFRNIGDLRTHFRTTPFLCLSATLQPVVRDYIHVSLHMQPSSILVKQPLMRANLQIVASQIQSKNGAWREFDFLFRDISSHIQIPKTMIFVESKQKCQILSNFLRGRLRRRFKNLANDIVQTVVLPYSAAYSDVDRESFMNDFLCGDCRIMTCTDAASLGLNIRNVDIVIQFNVNNQLTIGDVVQRFGRCARDAEMEGLAVIFFPSLKCVPRNRLPLGADGIDFSMPITDENVRQVKNQLARLYLPESYEGQLPNEDPAIKWLRLTHGCRSRLLLAFFADDRALTEVESCCCDNCIFPARTECNRLVPPDYLAEMRPPSARNPTNMSREEIEAKRQEREDAVELFRDFGLINERNNFPLISTVRYKDTVSFLRDEQDRKDREHESRTNRNRYPPEMLPSLQEAVREFRRQVFFRAKLGDIGLREADAVPDDVIETIAKRYCIGWEFKTVADVQKILGKKVAVSESIMFRYIEDLFPLVDEARDTFLRRRALERSIAEEQLRQERERRNEERMRQREEEREAKRVEREQQKEATRQREIQLRQERDERRRRLEEAESARRLEVERLAAEEERQREEAEQARRHAEEEQRELDDRQRRQRKQNEDSTIRRLLQLEKERLTLFEDPTPLVSAKDRADIVQTLQNIFKSSRQRSGSNAPRGSRRKPTIPQSRASSILSVDSIGQGRRLGPGQGVFRVFQDTTSSQAPIEPLTESNLNRLNSGHRGKQGTSRASNERSASVGSTQNLNKRIRLSQYENILDFETGRLMAQEDLDDIQAMRGRQQARGTIESLYRKQVESQTSRDGRSVRSTQSVGDNDGHGPQ